MSTANDNAAVFARIAELEAMQAELKALKAKTANMPRMKVSQKGAISIYGLQRMPVTLYAGQWERIAQLVTDGTLAAFIEANEATLTRKGETPAPTTPTVTEAPKAPKKGRKTSRKATTEPTPQRREGPTAAELAKIEAHGLGFDID